MLKKKNIKIELMKERAILLEEERNNYAIPKFYNKFPLKENNVSEIEVHENVEGLEEVELNDIDREYLIEKFNQYKLLIEDIVKNHRGFIKDEELEEEIGNIIDPQIISEINLGSKIKIKIPDIPSVKLRSFKKWRSGMMSDIRVALPELLQQGGTIADGGKFIDALIESLNTNYINKATKKGTGRSVLGEILYKSSGANSPWKTNHKVMHAKLKKLLTTLRDTKADMWNERLNNGDGGFTPAGKKVLKEAGIPLGKNGEPAIRWDHLRDEFQIDGRTAKNLEESILSHAISKYHTYRINHKIKTKLRDQYYTTQAEFQKWGGKMFTIYAKTLNRIKNTFKEAKIIKRTKGVPVNDLTLVENQFKDLWRNINSALKSDEVGTIQKLESEGYINFFSPKVLEEVKKIAKAEAAEVYVWIEVGPDKVKIPLYGSHGKNLNISGQYEFVNGVWVPKKLKPDTGVDTPTIKPDEMITPAQFLKKINDLLKDGWKKGDPPKGKDVETQSLVDPDYKVHDFWRKKKQIETPPPGFKGNLLDGLKAIWSVARWVSPYVSIGANITKWIVSKLPWGNLLQQIPRVGKVFRPHPFGGGMYVSKMMANWAGKQYTKNVAGFRYYGTAFFEVPVRLVAQNLVILYIQQLFVEKQRYIPIERQNTDTGGTDFVFALCDQKGNRIPDDSPLYDDEEFVNATVPDADGKDIYINRCGNDNYGKTIYPFSDEEIDQRLPINWADPWTTIGGHLSRYFLDWRGALGTDIEKIIKLLTLKSAVIKLGCAAMKDDDGEFITGLELQKCEAVMNTVLTETEKFKDQYDKFIDTIKDMGKCLEPFKIQSQKNRKAAAGMSYTKLMELEIKNCKTLQVCKENQCAELRNQISALGVSENKVREVYNGNDGKNKIWFEKLLQMKDMLDVNILFKQMEVFIPKVTKILWNKDTGEFKEEVVKEAEQAVPIPWNLILKSTGTESILGKHMTENYLCSGCDFCYVDCTELQVPLKVYNKWDTTKTKNNTNNVHQYMVDSLAVQEFWKKRGVEWPKKEKKEESRKLTDDLITEQRNKLPESKYDIVFEARAITLVTDTRKIELKIETIIEQALQASMNEGITWEQFVDMNGLQWLYQIPLAQLEIGEPKIKWVKGEKITGEEEDQPEL